MTSMALQMRCLCNMTCWSGSHNMLYCILLSTSHGESAVVVHCRGFTTLSTTLGHLVIALHDGLLHAISNEAITAPLVNMLKALQTLMASAAYSRLPTDMLPRCIEVGAVRLLMDVKKAVTTSV